MTSFLDHAGRPIVAVTGIGLVTALGVGVSDNWRKLTAGESGIRAIKHFATDCMKTRIAGDVSFVPSEMGGVLARSEAVAALAAEEAVAQAGIGSKGDFPGPLFMAVPPVEMNWEQRLVLAAAARRNDACTYDDLLRAAGSADFRRYHPRLLCGSISEHIVRRFGTKGSPIEVQTACASGASAIQLGVEAIRRGETESALCIGADASVSPEVIIRFSLLAALSTHNDPPEGAARPFARDRDGFVMAEGAGALVLESLAAARARGARILGIVAGCGEKADSFHLTRSSPDGGAIIASIAGAVSDAGLAPGDIDYVNAHGTGTAENDKMECLGITTVFGEHAEALPVSSNKSMIGHALSAAGAIEAVFSLLTLEHQRLPPTINYRDPDPAIPLDVVPNVARDARVQTVLSNSFGFGGQNVSLVLAREPA